MTPARAIATVGGVGLLRPAPGTWGTLVALPLAWALHTALGFGGLAVATVVVTALGWWAVARASQGLADPDASEFVIDEVAGMWLALWPVSLGAAMQGVDILALWPGWVVAFALFRLFDIWKPGPIGRADRMGTPWGVMADDLLAGVAAAVGVALLALLAHGVMAW
ncbi:phosphatidylglycerophosphatase A [Rhodobaculum claviforme]|uniref:Phosphatidylglycerophosphatase A n=1 Tax=Rhodobaculum claviforme TaxID=1549854 RepID=A0A934TK50_9RHOB|nr:phosphatidylglycerophosphatase A [Rhodobaculum claviforme]MBK5927635.1 phosphatidylglycerophosphatase A [Rhodobaculum claviforme]